MEEHSSVALVELPVGPGRWTEPFRDATRVAMLGTEASATNLAIVEAWSALGVDIALVRPDAISTIRPGDVVLGRIDILPTIDGVEPGLLDLLRLERRGLRVLNSATALASAHDKLLTARLLARAALPHPRTVHVRRAGDLRELRPPVVVKPRLGSWGVDVHRCDTEEDLRECFEEIATRTWFSPARCARPGAGAASRVRPQAARRGQDRRRRGAARRRTTRAAGLGLVRAAAT